MIWPSVQLCSVCDLLRFLARSFFLFISNMFFCTEFHVDVSTVIKHFFPSSQLFSFHFCQFLCMFFSDLAHFAFFFSHYFLLCCFMGFLHPYQCTEIWGSHQDHNYCSVMHYEAYQRTFYWRWHFEGVNVSRPYWNQVPWQETLTVLKCLPVFQKHFIPHSRCFAKVYRWVGEILFWHETIICVLIDLCLLYLLWDFILELLPFAHFDSIQNVCNISILTPFNELKGHDLNLGTYAV